MTTDIERLVSKFSGKIKISGGKKYAVFDQSASALDTNPELSPIFWMSKERIQEIIGNVRAPNQEYVKRQRAEFQLGLSAIS